MSQVTIETIKAIGRVRTQIELLQFEDNENLIKVGAALEAVMNEIPESCTLAIESVVLCLHALQAVFQGEAEDIEQIRQGISATLIGIEQGLAFPPHPAMDKLILRGQAGLRSELEKISQASDEPAQSEEAVEEVQAAEETAAIEEASAEPEIKTEITSLDDIASLLIQVDAGDKEDLMRLRDSVKRMSGQTEHSESVRKLLSQTAREINQVVKTGNPEFLNKAGSLIEEAMNILENGEPAVEESSVIQEVKKENAVIPESKKEVSAINENKAETPVKAEIAAKSDEKNGSDLTPDVVSTDEGDRALLTEFVTESSEYIEAAEGALLLLENEPDNAEAINTVFRAFHTVKGTAAFLGFSRLAELAHFAESLLSRMRDKEIRCVGGYANVALRSSDQIKEMVLAVGEALNGKPLTLPETYEELINILKNPEAAGVSDGETSAPIKETEPVQEEISAVQQSKTSVSTNEKMVDSTVRVRTDRLDSLIDIVGELVIAQSMLAQDSTANQAGQHELARKISHAGKIVRELQTLTMTMRMIPLKNTFQKMARVVRDVAHKCGKQVEFVTEGEETEIDRNMVDIVADPLIHMVRNAVDHGIELPDLREENGKSRTGKVRLAAYHAGGDVVVELHDDGAGLDAEKLLKKAIDKGLVESDKNLSESEIYNLIFAPGFSTAEQVTDVSGRGVGMDVVRRNIEAMRGRVEISSEKGKGSLFTIRLPLTLAITDGMLVRVGNERYIIPTVHIHLSFRPNANSISTVAGKGEMVHLRGELMPIVRLHSLFEVSGGVENPTEGSLVIVADGRRRCAILVDELLGQQQAVAKTLGRGVGKIQGVSGGAILGDGRVGLILDTAELVALGRQITDERDRQETPLRKVA